MKIRAGIVAAVALLLTLGAWASAQVFEERVQPPVTFSGGDVGFRVEARRADAVVGKLVIRVNGKWVDAEFGGGTLRLSTR